MTVKVQPGFASTDTLGIASGGGGKTICTWLVCAAARLVGNEERELRGAALRHARRVDGHMRGRGAATRTRACSSACRRSSLRVIDVIEVRTSVPCRRCLPDVDGRSAPRPRRSASGTRGRRASTSPRRGRRSRCSGSGSVRRARAGRRSVRCPSTAGSASRSRSVMYCVRARRRERVDVDHDRSPPSRGRS